MVVAFNGLPVLGFCSSQHLDNHERRFHPHDRQGHTKSIQKHNFHFNPTGISEPRQPSQRDSTYKHSQYFLLVDLQHICNILIHFVTITLGRMDLGRLNLTWS